jgi:hypothetical protein
VGLVERDDLGARRAGEGGAVADGETGVGRGGVVEAVGDELEAGLVVVAVALELVLDGGDFAVAEVGVEARGDEEAGEAFEGAFERGVGDLQVVVGVVAGGVGVVGAAVGLDVLVEFARVGEAVGAEEDEVLEVVGEPGAGLGVSKLPVSTARATEERLNFGFETRRTRRPLSRTRCR